MRIPFFRSLCIFQTLLLTTSIHALATTSKNLKAAVIVPGFLTGADEFKDLCSVLTNRCGIPTVAVPMPNWHWLPCLGGRSARPILERIDCTVKHLIAADGDIAQISPSLFDYSLPDVWEDFQTNPGGAMQVGGAYDVDNYPSVEPQGKFALPESITSGTKVALIGHSAGGWIARAYLSDRKYGGKSYSGNKFVHSLVTLGTPNLNAPGPAFEGIRWVNRESSLQVPSLAVGGTGFDGDSWGALTKGSYTFCSADGSEGTSFTGDGVTPIHSSLAFPGAETLELPGVHHFCWSDVLGGSFVSPELTDDYRKGAPWYGSEEIADKWAHFLLRETT
eukprot:CAMPEP_0194217330 /NCGR_PEP_ID=MMETSP0156-20130528/21009_1 /TAXON_ID=33649 /ORGANISM="Thalassionema nitzschioides, Strain L26-B" /LENGTH=333 /DNA_ID=CAMNT_0038946349 /DNA_START=8 /DNA_END=1009 /DNA_ORIENTATION=+